MNNFSIENKTICIGSVAELSLQQLSEVQAQQEIEKIQVMNGWGSDTYSVKDYKKIYEKLLELTDGIDSDWSRKKKFIHIYGRVSSQIEYDYIAGYPKKWSIMQKVYSKINRRNCRNLKNGLLQGKCVCAGYAEILRNACLLKGVPAITIIGPINDGGLHAWNQIEIEEGKWIEVDSTWDHNEGVSYIGTDKQEFWNRHRRSKNIGLAIYPENLTDNFDLDEFINSEFGLPTTYAYDHREQIELLNVIKGQHMKQGVETILGVRERRLEIEREFEQQYGYTKEDLRKLGFTEDEICKLQAKYDTKTGEKINRDKVVSEQVEERKKAAINFENTSGYKLSQLRELGFTDYEINQMQQEFLTKREKVINMIEERRIEKKSEEALGINMQMLEEQAEGIHPDILRGLISGVRQKILTIPELYKIIDLKTGKLSDQEFMIGIRKKIREKFERQQFEGECGYTIERLIELGFNDTEIKKLVRRFDPNTGKKLNRRKIVEQAVQERETRIQRGKLADAYIEGNITETGIGQAYRLLETTRAELATNPKTQNTPEEHEFNK